ncbi:hypothetical protein [Deinococcus sp. QL22]|uniref:hypothetical protein n=1 Tax=Deinococcus sp. QL22 TaxID=2939437 RepID=UPI002017F55B|nr:hypothetical protein [Deinococcus sp. QL22]UQN08902.1 hypothetical protein M1R55_20110 [Deinococcus sp. QL22]
MTAQFDELALHDGVLVLGEKLVLDDPLGVDLYRRLTRIVLINLNSHAIFVTQLRLNWLDTGRDISVARDHPLIFSTPLRSGEALPLLDTARMEHVIASLRNQHLTGLTYDDHGHLKLPKDAERALAVHWIDPVGAKHVGFSVGLLKGVTDEAPYLARLG